MSDGAISQDEIDALLSGVGLSGLGGSGSATANTVVLSDAETNVVTDFYNELLPKLGESLGSFINDTVSFKLNGVKGVNREKMLKEIPEMTVAVMANYNSDISGDHFFIISPEFAQKLASLINKEENIELDDMSLSVISEFFSQFTGVEITSLSEKPGLEGLVSDAAEGTHCPKAMVRFPAGDFVCLEYSVNVEGQDYTLWEILSSGISKKIASALGAPSGGTAPDAGQQVQAPDMAQAGGMQQMPGQGMPMNGMQQMPMQGMPVGGMQQMPMQGMPMGGMQQMPMQGMAGGGMQQMGMNVPNVQSVQFPNLMMQQVSGEQGNISLIMDVYMEMSVELGRTRKLIKEILSMGEGTIIELDKLAGEPVDILVNHKPIAKGEVVVIDENFGVRVTEILSPGERIPSVN